MTIPNSLIEKVRKFLGSDGIDFFKKVYEEHGHINAVWMEGKIPHPVHFQEGMQVRNFMRRQMECKGWGDHDYDNRWVEVVELTIKET